MTSAETFLALSSLHHQVCFDCSGFLLLTADSLCPPPPASHVSSSCPDLPALTSDTGQFVCVWPLENHGVMLGKHPNHHHLSILRSIKVPSAAVAPEGECRGCSPLRVPDWRSPDTRDYVGKRQSSCPRGGQVSPGWMLYLFYLVLGLLISLILIKWVRAQWMSLLHNDINCIFFLLISIFGLWFVDLTDPPL